MESISSRNLPLVLHTLNQIELAIDRHQERTKNIRSADDFLSTPGGMEKLDAACMVLIALGESIKNLDKVSEGKLLPTYSTIPWKKVGGIRIQKRGNSEVVSRLFCKFAAYFIDNGL